MAWRDAIRATAERHRPGHPLPGPVWVRLVFRMRRPKYHFGTGRNAKRLKPSAPATHTNRPDLDNLVKAVLDVLGQLSYWRDDSQIVQVDARKEWGEPGVDVEVAA
jgi:Holliday junction resolvase RusA-like endonuclease